MYVHGVVISTFVTGESCELPFLEYGGRNAYEKMSTMLNFYGFTPRRCEPPCIIGKAVKKSNIYYNDDDGRMYIVAMYRYDRDADKYSIYYPSPTHRKCFKDKLSKLHKYEGTPKVPLRFIMRMLDYLELLQSVLQCQEKGYDGLLALTQKDGAINRVVPLTKDDTELSNHLTKENCGGSFYLTDPCRFEINTPESTIERQMSLFA